MDTHEIVEHRLPKILLPMLALVAAGIGALALMGWLLKVPWLSTFGTGLIPMAPSTAVLFLFYGTTIFLRSWMRLSRRVFRASAIAGFAGAMAAILLFTLACKDIHLEIEHLGLDIRGTLNGAPIGYMSMVTAFCFVLVSLSFLASLSPSLARSRRAIPALGSAGLLLGACLVFLLAYLYGAPLLYGGGFIPPALNTIFAFAALSLALLILAWAPSGALGSRPREVPETSHLLLLVFVLLAAGIVTTGYLYYRHYEQTYRSEVEGRLSAIAELKVGELTSWRRERMADGEVLFNNGAFSSLVRRALVSPTDSEARRQLQEWMGKYVDNCQYDQIRLLDAQGATQVVVPSNRAGVSSTVVQRVPEILRTSHVTFQDFYRNEHDQRVYLAILVPILEGADAHRPLGVLVLRIAPDVYLYPFIKRWPTPSATAETLLVRREGHDVVFLNELRFATNTALNLRAPLGGGTAVPAIQAVLGMESVMEGRDYRNVPVLAALRTIPDSPWALVARMDMMEVYAPMRERLWQVVIMMGILLFGAGASVGLVWRHQRARYYRDRAEVADALQQSSRDLQAKNVELEHFLYTASHDLKSPVVTVRTFLGYLEQDIAAADAGRIGKDLQFIRAATDKMGRLLDELLELSRIGRVVSPPVPVALRGLVDEAIGAVAGRIAEQGVEVKVDDPGVMLRGDRLRLAEIWQNLVENAVKFVANVKDPRVEIGVEMRGKETLFFVRDNGIGIDRRYFQKVFGLFEKLDPKSEGTGMGLAIVKRIVELYQGRIWVESAGSGQGSCFYFTLPGALKLPVNSK